MAAEVKLRVLITGITGFVGSHLAEYLLSHESTDVFGTVRHRSPLDNISKIKDRLTIIHDVDMRDAHAVESAIEVAAPDYIFHLAAQSFVPASWVSPADTININVMGTVNLLEAVRRSELNTVTQIAGSSEEYGCPPLRNVDEEGDSDYDSDIHTFGINQTSEKAFKLPITEDFPLLPLSPYGVSKVAEDLLGFQYHKSYGMKIVRTRAFNHTGERRGESFVTSNFAKQIAEIEKGKRDVVSVGNLEAKRDFTDVRDIVMGYWFAATKGKYGEVYNLCSGKARSIQTVLDTLRMHSTAQFEIVEDKSRLRPSDIPILEGSSTKFRRRTGWRAEIGFSKTMGDLLDYWRGRV